MPAATTAPAEQIAPAVSDRVELRGDIPFRQATNAEGALETLRLDVYLPAGDTHDTAAAARPGIVWFHGGGFRPGNDKRQRYVVTLSNEFAARGYVCIAPDYRVRDATRQESDEDRAATVRDAVEDGRAALEWVRARAAEYRLDPRRLVVAGGSAGGMLLLNLCHDPQAPIDAARDGIVALIDMWGTPGPAQRRYYERVSPTAPPTLIVHGTADALVPFQNSATFIAELEAAGVPHALLALPDAPHTPMMHADQIIATIARFLDEHVPGA